MRTRLVGWVALALHCTIVLAAYLTVFLSVPRYAVAGFSVLWVALLGLVILLLRRSSVWAIAVPVTALAAWAALTWAGDHFLGWTA